VPDISDTIETTATDGVQRASVDGRSVDAVPIPDLVRADQYVSGKTAASRRARGLRFTKLFKGGHTDDRYSGGSR